MPTAGGAELHGNDPDTCRGLDQRGSLAFLEPSESERERGCSDSVGAEVGGLECCFVLLRKKKSSFYFAPSASPPNPHLI